MLEPHCWLFGPEFYLATSDQAFRTVVRRHRDLAGLRSTETDLATVAGIVDIPDLFLAAQRDYPTSPQHHHLLVELKAPRVNIGDTEIAQIRRYWSTISQSAEFDKASTRWDLFLVSADVQASVEEQRSMAGLPHGLIYPGKGGNIWVLKWSEIITRAREELQLVLQHLERQSNELSVTDYIKEHYPALGQRLVRIDQSQVPS